MSVFLDETPLRTAQALGTPQLTPGTPYIGSSELGSTPTGLASVLCPGKSHSLHCFNPGHRVLVTHRWGEPQREGTDTEALRCVFPASAYFQGAPVPRGAERVMGDAGRSRLPLKKAMLSEELPGICTLSLVGRIHNSFPTPRGHVHHQHVSNEAEALLSGINESTDRDLSVKWEIRSLLP